MTASRGALIVLEGVDRVGKSTQCSLLVDALKARGTPAELVRFPDRSTPIGHMINDYLQAPPTDSDSDESANDRLIHLLFSANRWEKVGFLRHQLAAGTTLVVDRYAFSGAAYSAAKRSLSLSWCCQSDVGLPRPDLVLFLSLPTDVTQQRAGFGGERYERSDFQQRVRDNYQRLFDEQYWRSVDGSGSREEVLARLLPLAEQCVLSDRSQEVPELWTKHSPPPSEN